MGNNFKDITGMKYGRLTVIEKSNERDINGCVKWVCKCECGNIIIANGSKLRMGKKNSCGCLMKEHQHKQYYKHGHTGERMFNIWRKIKQRCYYKNDIDYKHYGGRGIIMCEEWKNDFINFYNWSNENSYNDELTIDRIDNDGNYEPNNCRWVDRYVQANNKRNNRYVEYKGEVHSIGEWSRILKINDKLLYSRIIDLKWTPEKAFNTKPIKGRNQYTK